MKCFICDSTLSKPRYNSDHEEYEPCEHCLAVIQETLDGFKDNASVEEDDFGGPDPIINRYSQLHYVLLEEDENI